MTPVPKIGIVYLSFHSEEYLPDVFDAWTTLTYPKDRLTCIIVDNPHPTHSSSVDAIEQKKQEYAGKIPELVVLPQTENLGFAGGNNVGIQWAIDHGCDYVFLHNADGFMDAHALEPLIEACEKDKTIGVAQSLVLLYPEKDLVNAAGNSYHYLGFGFCNEYRTALKDLKLQPIADVSYVSGAATMLRADLLKQFGLWDKDFFLYHEDMEYAFRLRMAGYRSVVVRQSFFYHKYQFLRSIERFYWMERNRIGVLLMFFRIPTLLLLLPMLIVLEVGLWFFSLRNGTTGTRVRTYRYWLDPMHWKLWCAKRRHIQSIRKIRDRDLLRNASPTIQFQEEMMKNPVLMYLGNPVMFMYYWLIVRGLIWW